MPARSTLTLRNRLAIGAVVAAPVLAVIGSGLQPKDSNNAATEVLRFTAHRDRFFVGYLLMALGFWLFVPASTALMRLFRDRGSRVGVVSCIVMAIGGVFFGAGNLMVGTIQWVLTGGAVSRSAAAAVVHAADHSNAAGITWFVGMLLILGFLAIGATLLYARSVPWWQGALLIVGAVAVFLSGSGASSIPLGLPIIAAFALLAWSIVRAEAGSAPAVVDVSAAVPSQARHSDAPQAQRTDA